ncbi:SDR family oxidoreductase [Nocardioides panacisoli]|uniref:SDR family oxidoreductase n=1 Tax=Nocardioides panacisoli TaxID=627624 RepID=UPI001C632F8E|nr:SDR family oxidoreductase [Nocardioides panacisoli]QYJ04929.1 SDR family oxidoreductase [Nocardioides panacisoli]
MSIEVDLHGRVALVTGGTRGIGRGIAEVLLEAGATVVVCSRSVAEPPAGATHRTCDVRDPESVAELVDGVLADHDRLDIVVNNAGGAPYAPAAEASPRLHEKVVGLNLVAPLLVSQVAHRAMAERGGGVILNVSSIGATRPSPGTAAYGAAKAGLDALTTSLAQEWGTDGVRVNAIDVGLVRTPDTADHYGGDTTVAAIERTIPLGRMADPREVGRVAAFLASDLASYVTGACVACHGGGEPPVFLHIVQSGPAGSATEEKEHQ